VRVDLFFAQAVFGLRVDDLPREQAGALMATAPGVCPYSNATRGNIDVALVVGSSIEPEPSISRSWPTTAASPAVYPPLDAKALTRASKGRAAR
jgi:hypothetical protein